MKSPWKRLWHLLAEPAVAGNTLPVADSSQGTRRSPYRRRTRAVPEQTETFFIPRSVIEATSDTMRRFGRERRECYVWWGGYFSSDGSAQVLTAIYPDMPTDYGRIRLGREEFGTLQRELRQLDQALIVELHTHPPGAGGQNAVDAAHAAAPYAGFISIVVPEFGFVDLVDLTCCYVYEYVSKNEWCELDPSEVSKRFVVDDTARCVRFDE